MMKKQNLPIEKIIEKILSEDPSCWKEFKSDCNHLDYCSTTQGYRALIYDRYAVRIAAKKEIVQHYGTDMFGGPEYHGETVNDIYFLRISIPGTNGVLIYRSRGNKKSSAARLYFALHSKVSRHKRTLRDVAKRKFLKDFET